MSHQIDFAQLKAHVSIQDIVEKLHLDFAQKDQFVFLIYHFRKQVIKQTLLILVGGLLRYEKKGTHWLKMNCLAAFIRNLKT